MNIKQFFVIIFCLIIFIIIVSVSLINKNTVEVVVEKENPQAVIADIKDYHISYSEFLELITLYNTEIRKTNLTGKKFVLYNIDKNNTIINSLNSSILK